MDVWGKEDEVKEGGEEKAEESLVPGGAPPEPPYLLPPPEKKEGEEDPKPGGFDNLSPGCTYDHQNCKGSHQNHHGLHPQTQDGRLPHRNQEMGQLSWHCADSYTWR